MDDERLVALLERTAAAIDDAVAADLSSRPQDARDRGERPGQYRLDLVADSAAVPLLRRAGVGVLSEESGLDDPGAGIVVVLDPVDGSTNASRGLPWYATSLCAVDDRGPRAALVANLATGRRYSAVRGGGARCDGRTIAPSAAVTVDGSFLVLNGYPGRYLGWRQYRSLGATALDLCSVADGRVDASLDCSDSALGPWDYLGALLVLREAGAHIADAQGRELVVVDHEARRSPVAAATPELLDELLSVRPELPAW